MSPWILGIGNKVSSLGIIKKENGSIGALMFSVSKEQFKKLKEREANYFVEEIEALDFLTKKKIGDVYIFVPKKSASRTDVLPLIGYYIRVWFGARQIDKIFNLNGEFVSNYLKTTYVYNDGELISLEQYNAERIKLLEKIRKGKIDIDSYIQSLVNQRERLEKQGIKYYTNRLRRPSELHIPRDISPDKPNPYKWGQRELTISIDLIRARKAREEAMKKVMR